MSHPTYNRYHEYITIEYTNTKTSMCHTRRPTNEMIKIIRAFSAQLISQLHVPIPSSLLNHINVLHFRARNPIDGDTWVLSFLCSQLFFLHRHTISNFLLDNKNDRGRCCSVCLCLQTSASV